MLHPTENTVEQAPATRARFNAPDFASGARALARGGEALGQGIEQVADAADKIGEQYDEAAVRQADAEDLKQVAQIRAKVMSSKGFDTQTELEAARQQLTELRKTRMTSLHNNRQRTMYADVFDRRQAGLEESFTTHSLTQIAEANQNAATARADSSADYAVDTFGTNDFDVNMGTALNEVAAANKGAAPETIQRQQAKMRSSILSRAISAMIADPDQAEHAKLALEQHAADILPEDEEKLHRQLNPIIEENRIDAAVGEAFTDVAKGAATTLEAKGDVGPLPQGSGAPSARPIEPADPLRGKGRITDNAAVHRARGSGNALDIAAPAGTPIYTPMSGKVVKSWYDQKGGWSVLVEHPNGYVTGYAHLRSKSPYSEGQAVEPTVAIGSVGATGDATGPHVHYTVRQSRGGPKVDPSAVLWDSKGTVKPGSVSWKEGPLQHYTADENALGAALDHLHAKATAENWSPRFYEKAVTRARQVAGVQNELRNQQQEDLYNGALQTVVNLHDKFTSVSQIPGFGLLKPAQQYSLQNIADANKKAAAGEGVKANGDRFLLLMGMGQSPEYRQQFLNVDLGAESGITAGERARLLERQIKLRQEPDGALAASLGKADYFANRYLPTKNFSAEKRQAFSQRFMDAVERQQNALGRPLNDKEMDETARSLTVEVARPGGGVARGFEVLGSGQGGAVNIPNTFNGIDPAVRQAITDDLARQGKPHSMRDVVAEWLRSRSR
jgi:murein DD-endopeptidase MepM/ murein hydrolase activator NlpD